MPLPLRAPLEIPMGCPRTLSGHGRRLGGARKGQAAIGADGGARGPDKAAAGAGDGLVGPERRAARNARWGSDLVGAEAVGACQAAKSIGDLVGGAQAAGGAAERLQNARRELDGFEILGDVIQTAEQGPRVLEGP